MPTEKLLTRPNESAADAIATLEARDPLPTALQHLHRALHKTSIYPVGHPSIGNAIERAHVEMVRALAGRSSVMIGVTRTHLLIDGVPVDDASVSLGALAQLLHDLDVAVVELRPSLTVEELERFLLQIREARLANRTGAALAVALTEDRLENIRIVPLDYWGLSFATQGEASRNKSFDEVWESLVMSLAAPVGGIPESEPEALAQEANQQFFNHEEVGTGSLQKQLRSFGRHLGSMDDWQRDALRTRVGRFVSGLNPSLRQDLLRVDPMNPEESFELIAELADTLNDATLLDVLSDISRSGQSTHQQFLGFLNKMARLPASREDAAVDLEDVAQRWQISSSLQTRDTGSFRTALREILVRRKQIECNPGAYQELLDDLIHRELPPATRKVLERYRNPADEADVRSQAVELAIYLLQDGPPDEHVPGMLAHVGAATDPLIDAGQYQHVRDAAAAARCVLTREQGSEANRRAASSYLRDFTAASRIDRILDGVVHADKVPSAIEPLLLLGGRASLDLIIDRLETALPVHVVPVLQSIALNLGREAMAQVLKAREQEGWARLRPALPLIRQWPPEEAILLLQGLDVHRDARIRKDVLLLACELAPTPEAVERHLEAALGDRDAGIVLLAVHRLSSLATARALEILAAYLEGSLPAGAPDPAHVRRIVSAMLAIEGGLPRACRALDALAMTLRPSKARAGAIVRQVLVVHRQDAAVAACIARWKRSPGFLVSFFFPPAAAAAEERA